MAVEYKGFNIPEKVIIVKREVCEWQNGKRIGTGVYQGYVVASDNKKMLETALNWAGCKYKYNDGKYEYPDKDKYITEYTNGTFELKLTNAAASSSQSGKLSFWDCTIKAEDGNSYLVGINSDLLCSLLINSTFVNGVCQSKVWLGRQGGNRVGAFTETMDEFIQAKKDAELRTRKMSTKYEAGQRVFTKTGQSVYLGTMYKLVDIEHTNTREWPYYRDKIVIYDKPQLVHAYGSYDYEYISGLRSWTRVYNLNKVSGINIEQKKTNQYFNEGETFDIGPTYEEYCKIKDEQLKRNLECNQRIANDCKRESYKTDKAYEDEQARYARERQKYLYEKEYEKACYTDDPNKVLSKEELDKLLEVIKNYVAYRYSYYQCEPDYNKINNYTIEIGSKHGK